MGLPGKIRWKRPEREVRVLDMQKSGASILERAQRRQRLAGGSVSDAFEEQRRGQRKVSRVEEQRRKSERQLAA